jgi:predicted amidophosphoribosyltransferase
MGSLTFDGKPIKKSGKRGIWKKRSISRCNMLDRPGLHKKGNFYYASFWKKSKDGKLLKEIKKDKDNIEVFAKKTIDYIASKYNNLQEFCIVTTPKRRHKTSNFSDCVCKYISNVLQIPYYADIIKCMGRSRINPKFRRIGEIAEQNIILFDDIITTGSTITATYNLLGDKNIIVIVGVNNNK